uniref:Uncharacterized protein n=1 Tax=Arundo donax TaxID=35708 RepID=A0A0A9HK61_ARUDO
MYAQNAISVNEFLGDSWNKVKGFLQKRQPAYFWLMAKTYGYCYATGNPRFHRITWETSSGISWTFS